MSDANSTPSSIMESAAAQPAQSNSGYQVPAYLTDNLSERAPEKTAANAEAAAQAAPAASPAAQTASAAASTQAPANSADYDLDLPDGMEPNAPLLEEFKTLAGEFKLNRDQARKLLDLEIKNARSAMERWQQQQKAWEGEIKTDKEFGGEKLPATVAAAKKALDHYDKGGTLFHELTRGGYGNHPAIIRFLARVGSDMREDSAHSGQSLLANKRPLRERLWPDSVMP